MRTLVRVSKVHFLDIGISHSVLASRLVRHYRSFVGKVSTPNICVAGCFHIGQFTDDRQSSRLRTLIAHYPPVQVGDGFLNTFCIRVNVIHAFESLIAYSCDQLIRFGSKQSNL